MVPILSKWGWGQSEMQRYLIIPLILPLLAGSGCQSVVVDLPPPPQSAGSVDQRASYRLQPGDVLEIFLRSNPELNEQVIVAPDGTISTQYASNVMAGGHTLQNVIDVLREKYGTQLNKPSITANIRSFVGTRVYVAGEVTTPSEIVANGQISALQAISRAGGFKITAQTDEIVLLRRDPENHAHLYAINMAAVIEGKSADADVMLEPYDVIFVPRDRIGNASLLFERVRNAVPFGTSFNYGLNNVTLF